MSRVKHLWIKNPIFSFLLPNTLLVIIGLIIESRTLDNRIIKKAREFTFVGTARLTLKFWRLKIIVMYKNFRGETVKMMANQEHWGKTIEISKSPAQNICNFLLHNIKDKLKTKHPVEETKVHKIYIDRKHTNYLARLYLLPYLQIYSPKIFSR